MHQSLSIRPSVLRMSSRTHNEFGIQFPRKRLPILGKNANKAGLSIKHNDLWNTIKSIIMINKEIHCFASGDFELHERNCAMSDGKQESISVAKLNFEPLFK